MDDEGRLTAQGFADLTAPVHGRLFEAALAMCRDADAAADLTQETLLRAFEARGRFRRGAPPYPWLVRILRNLFVDQRRSAVARREVAVAELPAAEHPARDPLAEILADESGVRVRAAIAALPPEQAVAVTLFDVQGLSYEEVASATDVPVGTVRSRLSRGRRRLLRLLRTEELTDSPCEESTVRGSATGSSCAQPRVLHRLRVTHASTAEE